MNQLLPESIDVQDKVIVLEFSSQHAKNNWKNAVNFNRHFVRECLDERSESITLESYVIEKLVVVDEKAADFLAAAARAKDEGKEEFEFAGKTYPVKMDAKAAEKIVKSMGESVYRIPHATHSYHAKSSGQLNSIKESAYKIALSLRNLDRSSANESLMNAAIAESILIYRENGGDQITTEEVERRISRQAEYVYESAKKTVKTEEEDCGHDEEELDEAALRELTIEDVAGFMGTAAAATAKGDKNFTYGGKKFKTTMDKEVAQDILDSTEDELKESLRGLDNEVLEGVLSKIGDFVKSRVTTAGRAKRADDKAASKEKKAADIEKLRRAKERLRNAVEKEKEEKQKTAMSKALQRKREEKKKKEEAEKKAAAAERRKNKDSKDREDEKTKQDNEKAREKAAAEKKKEEDEKQTRADEREKESAEKKTTIRKTLNLKRRS
jgi:hypothetical protein